ncbi:hypothetical protein GLP31_20110 [Photobacterium carnosum]|uniref:hypothetical protein n=1 Tax=Photobacterium carnosum TaxID=2023717 RepID=UPI001E46D63B|nr:hypothetical protein [Photobacterium carnosum]MCD9554772.1 hypothetical protein [Photobacterium carnosum]
MMLFEQVSRPFGFLFIRGVKGKCLYDWLLPVLLTVLTITLICSSDIATYSKINDSVINGIVGFISTLPGFYIAALAAIVAFQNKLLDEGLDGAFGERPYVNVNDINENREKTIKKQYLTRRYFLSSMFAFLTAESIVITMLNKLSPLFIQYNSVMAIYVVVIFFSLWQLIIVTLCGLYYLGERLHVK